MVYIETKTGQCHSLKCLYFIDVDSFKSYSHVLNWIFKSLKCSLTQKNCCKCSYKGINVILMTTSWIMLSIYPANDLILCPETNKKNITKVLVNVICTNSKHTFIIISSNTSFRSLGNFKRTLWQKCNWLFCLQRFLSYNHPQQQVTVSLFACQVKSSMLLWSGMKKKVTCRNEGGEERIHWWKGGRKRRSDMGVLTHCDPYSCSTSGIVGIYTFSVGCAPPYISLTHIDTHRQEGRRSGWMVCFCSDHWLCSSFDSLSSCSSRLTPVAQAWSLCLPPHSSEGFLFLWDSRKSKKQKQQQKCSSPRPLSTLFQHRARSAGLQSGRRSNAGGL